MHSFDRSVPAPCRVRAAAALALLLVAPSALVAQLVPAPTPDPTMPNVFYGATTGDRVEVAPVLVFVHGLGGSASFWWTRNDMYRRCYTIGFRTAFVSMSPDNSPNSASVAENAAVLNAALPVIAARFGVQKMYLIGHSKGGVDIQAALLDPSIAAHAKAVFTISTPNQGTRLADWAFQNPAIGQPLNLLSDAVADLRTASMQAFRAAADPVLGASGIPFYTTSGDTYQGDLLTAISGAILKSLTPGVTKDTFNDGLVNVGDARLPPNFAADLGPIRANHLDVDSGSVSLSRIAGRIQGLETASGEFEKVAGNGFLSVNPQGDSDNSWAWSMKWFKGKLYVGTGRLQSCVTVLTSDVRAGTSLYAAAVALEQCPAELASRLGAEIWRYTPETDTWERVFKSPNTIPIGFTPQGVPNRFTARDIGFRTMEIFEEPGGDVALYAGGVTSGSIYDSDNSGPSSFRGPRLLRSVDGLTWAPVPMTPGTFLGDLGDLQLEPNVKVRSFRSLKSYNGKLFATAADLIGNGVVIASNNPGAGDNAWEQVSPSRTELPVWALATFNGLLYATTGLTREQDPAIPGYGVFKTDATGPAPYQWTPVVTGGGHQDNVNFRSPNGLSMMEFKDRLYVGTNRPTELIRINPDDSWELVVGEPRMTPSGLKKPISGFGNGFGSGFVGHFWQMGVHNGNLYLGLWDWSAGIQDYSSLDGWNQAFTSQYGFDLLKTSDGKDWTFVTRTGFGDPKSWGARSFESTPFGLFVGSARQRGGLEIFRSVEPPPAPRPPVLRATSTDVIGGNVLFDWDPAPGAVRYHVYRAQTVPLSSLFGGSGNPGNSGPAIYPLSFGVVQVTPGLFHSEAGVSPELPSLYFVRSEDAVGNLSPPSNTISGPFKAAP